MPILEKEIEDRVVAWAKKNDFLAPKMKSVEAGWPDRLFISPSGATIFIEFKRPGQKPDKLQEYRLNELQRRGVPATWVDNYDEAISILKTALEPPPVPAPSYETVTVSTSCGAFFGSWAGQNINSVGSDQGPTLQIFDQESAGGGTSAPDVQRVAPRAPEMERFPGDDAWDSTRYTEGSNACE